MEEDTDALTDYAEDGVDLTLIRAFLSLTPAERLAFLQRQVDAIRKVRALNGVD
jgi:hypothetical protein